MWKFRFYLKDYKKESVIGPLFKLLEACFELVVPLVMASMIDVGVLKKDSTYLVKMGILLVGLGLLGLVCSLTAQYFAAKAAMGFGTAMRQDLFEKIQSLTYSQIDQVGSEVLVTRMTSDVNQLQSGVNLMLRLMLRSPFIVVGALVMAFHVDKKVGLVFLIVVPILACIIFGITYMSVPKQKKVQSGLESILRATKENLEGIRVIRSMGASEREKQDFFKENEYLFRQQMEVGNWNAVMNPLTYVVINLGMVAILYVGAGQIDAGRLLQGQVIALINYMTQILIALVALANLLLSFTRALASSDRLWQIFSLPEEKTTGNKQKSVKENAPLLQVEHLGFTYEKASRPALNEVSFTLQKGQVLGVIGGTGAGKTTLANLILPLYQKTKGEVYYKGTPISQWEKEALLKEVQLVPQKAVLFKGSILENMRMANEKATTEEIEKALTLAQAMDFVKKKEEGLSFFVQEGGKNLSGGQRQRLAIARALVANPQLLILDDSTSALDGVTEKNFWQDFVKEKKEMGVIIIGQRASLLKKADQIVVLEEGEVAGIGVHEELLDTCSVYREICLSQMEEQEVNQSAATGSKRN